MVRSRRMSILLATVLLGCATAGKVRGSDAASGPAVGAATLAQVYFWRAKPGKLADDYVLRSGVSCAPGSRNLVPPRLPGSA